MRELVTPVPETAFSDGQFMVVVDRQQGFREGKNDWT